MMRKTLRFACCLSIVALYGGCDELTEVLPAPAGIEAVEATLTGEVGSEITAEVEVTDEAGAPLGGVEVAWAAEAGSADPVTSITGANGRASTTWTLGATAGEQELTATTAGLDPVVITAIATAGEAAVLDATPDSVSFEAVGDTAHLSVSAADEFGNAVAVSPTWNVADSSVATVEAGVVTARGNGMTYVRVTAGGQTDSVAVTVAQVVASVVVSAGDTVAVGSSVALEAVAYDANGVVVPGVVLDWNTGDAAVATVDAAGAVTGESVGIVGIVVSAGTVTDTAMVLVTPRPENALATGSAHACALSVTGEAYCWGANRAGQLGRGDTIPSSTPVAVSGGLVFESIAAAGPNTCALTSAGEAYCWGPNGSGQLGTGTVDTIPALSPVQVTGGLAFEQVDLGALSFACGLDADGQAYCWGQNRYGQLGTGDTLNVSIPTAVQQAGVAYEDISLGLAQTCGRTAAGEAYCWGLNNFGALGTGDQTDRFTPTAVSGGLTFMALQTGATTSCGVAEDGSTYCWGKDFYGSLGTGAVSGVALLTTPTPIVGSHVFVTAGPGAENNIFTVSCGLNASGEAYCWGPNARGALGTDAATDTCGPLVEGADTFTCSGSPLAVHGGHEFSAISPSGGFACAVEKDGSAYCWGGNASGQLGSDAAAGTCNVLGEDEACSFEPLRVEGSFLLP